MWRSYRKALKMDNIFFYEHTEFLTKFSNFLKIRDRARNDIMESVREIIAEVKNNILS